MAIKRGEIYMVNLEGYDRSSVQRGYRPVLVISNNVGNLVSDVVIVAPLTTRDKTPTPTHYTFMLNGVANTVLLEQLVTVPKHLLNPFNGSPSFLFDDQMAQIDEGLAISVGLTAVDVWKMKAREAKANQARLDLEALEKKIPHAVQLMQELKTLIDRYDKNKEHVKTKKSRSYNRRTSAQIKELIYRYDGGEDKDILVRDFDFPSKAALYQYVRAKRKKELL